MFQEPSPKIAAAKKKTVLNKQRATFARLLRQIDADGKGEVTEAELRKAARDAGLVIPSDELATGIAECMTPGQLVDYNALVSSLVVAVDALGEYVFMYRDETDPPATLGTAAYMPRKTSVQMAAGAKMGVATEAAPNSLPSLPKRVLTAPSNSALQSEFEKRELPVSLQQEFKTLRRRLIDRIYRRNTSLRKVFRSFDPDHSGEIDHEELKQAVINLLPGQRPNAEVLQLLCDIMDPAGTGLIDFNGFARVLKDDDRVREDAFFIKNMQPNTKRDKYVVIDGHVLLNDNRTTENFERTGITDAELLRRAQYARAPKSSADQVALRGAVKELRHRVRENGAKLAQMFKRLREQYPGPIPRDVLVNELNTTLELTLGTAVLAAVLELGYANEDIDETKFMALFANATTNDEVFFFALSQRKGKQRSPAAMEVSPLGEPSLTEIPFGVMPDLVNSFNERVAAALAKHAKLERTLHAVDTDNDGLLSLSEFMSALQQLQVNLSEEEAKNVFARFDLQRTGKLDWKSFVAQIQIAPDKPTPQFLRPKSLRNSGDIIAWSTAAPETLTPSKNMMFSPHSARGIMSDAEEWRRLVGRPRTTGAVQPGPERPTTPPLSARLQEYRRKNPLLQKCSTEHTRPHVDVLPSDRDPKYVYGTRSAPSDNIRAILEQDFRRRWIDERLEHETRIQQLSPRPHRSQHTKASQARLDTLRQRQLQETTVSQPFKLSRFLKVGARVHSPTAPSPRGSEQQRSPREKMASMLHVTGVQRVATPR